MKIVNWFKESGFPECVGCGYCCTKATCIMGHWLHPEHPVGKQCPELVFKDGRHWCSLCLGDDPKAKRNREILHIGEGCPSTLMNTWREDVRNRIENAAHQG